MAPDGTSWAHAQDRSRRSWGRARPAPRGSPHREVQTLARLPSPTAGEQQMVPGTGTGLGPLLPTFTTQHESNTEGEPEVCFGERGGKPRSRRRRGRRGVAGVPEGQNQAGVSHLVQEEPLTRVASWHGACGPAVWAPTKLLPCRFSAQLCPGPAWSRWAWLRPVGQGGYRDPKRDQASWLASLTMCHQTE